MGFFIGAGWIWRCCFFLFKEKKFKEAIVGTIIMFIGVLLIILS